MKTYTTYFGTNGKTATQAKNKKEASEKMNVPVSKVSISHVYIDYVNGAEKIN